MRYCDKYCRVILYPPYRLIALTNWPSALRKFSTGRPPRGAAIRMFDVRRHGISTRFKTHSLERWCAASRQPDEQADNRGENHNPDGLHEGATGKRGSHLVALQRRPRGAQVADHGGIAESAPLLSSRRGLVRHKKISS